MKKVVLGAVIIAFLTVFLIVIIIVPKYLGEDSQLVKDMRFGKNIYLTIPETETIDYEYLNAIIDGKIEKNTSYFNLINNKELKKLSEFLKKNNYYILPGEYIINQAWKFNDGVFVGNDKKKHEVFVYMVKEAD